MEGFIFLLILILLVIFGKIAEYRDRKKILGNLTGKFRHKKSPNGNYLEVEVKLKKEIFFRRASNLDVEKLRKIHCII